MTVHLNRDSSTKLRHSSGSDENPLFQFDFDWGESQVLGSGASSKQEDRLFGSSIERPEPPTQTLAHNNELDQDFASKPGHVPEMPSRSVESSESNCCNEIEDVKCLSCLLKTSMERTCLVYPSATGCEQLSLLHPVIVPGTNDVIAIVIILFEKQASYSIVVYRISIFLLSIDLLFRFGFN